MMEDQAHYIFPRWLATVFHQECQMPKIHLIIDYLVSKANMALKYSSDQHPFAYFQIAAKSLSFCILHYLFLPMVFLFPLSLKSYQLSSPGASFYFHSLKAPICRQFKGEKNREQGRLCFMLANNIKMKCKYYTSVHLRQKLQAVSSGPFNYSQFSCTIITIKLFQITPRYVLCSTLPSHNKMYQVQMYVCSL